jgi:CubicO group peptidase (beta-lactamase class C family)
VKSALVLFALAVVVYAPFRSAVPYHWDSAEFVVAVREFDVAKSQPHAPGYLVYVLLGRLLEKVTGDPHAALVWLSVLAGAGLVAAVGGLGTAMFDRGVGWAAAALTLTSPQVWFHSVVALTYVVHAFALVLTVAACWRAIQKAGRWVDVIVVAGLLAFSGALRPQAVPALLPLIGYTIWRCGRPIGGKVALGTLVTAGLTAAWVLPMVELSGGWPTYMELLRRHRELNAAASPLSAGWAAAEINLVRSVMFCWLGLGLGLPVALGAMVYRVRHRPAGGWRDGLTVIALWVLPLVALGIIGVMHQPGYVLDYLIGLILLTAFVAMQLPARAGWVAAVVVANAAVFLAWPAKWDGACAFLTRSARVIRQHDANWQRLVTEVRAHADPRTTLLCFPHWSAEYGLRHAQLLLPEFSSVQLLEDHTMLTPPSKSFLGTRAGIITFYDAEDVHAWSRRLLVVPPGTDMKHFARHFDWATAQPVGTGVVQLLVLEDRR